MTTSEKIRTIRKEKGLTQKELGQILGVTQATVGQYESGPNPPKIETLKKIAMALEVPLVALIGDTNKKIDWFTALEQKLSHVGSSVGYYEEDSILWINYPDGTLEVTLSDLEDLNKSIDSYICFKLNELKNNNASDFREKK